jgi:hypothetical protein
MNGEQHLRRALRRFRQLRKPPSAPSSLSDPGRARVGSSEPIRSPDSPSTAFEAILLQRIDDLEDRIAKLESRVNWLLVTIVGACLVFILRTLLP